MTIKFKFTNTALKMMRDLEELSLASGENKTIDFTPKRATNGSSGYDL